MEADRLVLEGGLVLRADGEAERLDVVIDGDAITALTPPGGGPAEARKISAHDKAIVPGLINGHVHGHGTLAKGLVEDRWPLELFLNALPGLGANRTSDDKYLNGLVGAAEMIRKGCTACFDLFFEFPQPSPEGLFALGQAYSDAGIRAVVAPMVADKTFYQAYPELIEACSPSQREAALSLRLAPGEAVLASAVEAFRRWPFDRERIRPGLAPSIPLHCSDDFLIACRDLAREFDLPMQTHLAESKVQAVTGLKRYGRTITAHVEALGLLGPHFSAAHAIWLDGDDLARLAGAGVSAIHAPASNLRFGSGMAQTRAMIESGINVGLATDAANSSDALNMFEAMRWAASLSAVQTHDFTRWLGVADALRMATEGSAQALGFAGELGRVAPGYKADLVLLDLAHINYVPLGHLGRQMVFGENGAAVDSVMIGGRWVMERGNLTTIDEAKLRRDANAAAARLFEANAEARSLARRLQPAVGTFCRSLACHPYSVRRIACETTS